MFRRWTFLHKHFLLNVTKLIFLPVPLPNPPGDLLDRRAGDRDRERERPPPEMQTSF